MKVKQLIFNSGEKIGEIKLDFVPDILLIFVSPEFKEIEKTVESLALQFPTTSITGCSTSGEIQDINVKDNSMVINALKFEKTKHKMVSKNIKNCDCSKELGSKLFKELDTPDLRHILIFSDGLIVNGADLVLGLKEYSSDKVSITGGLAADGDRFESTFIIKNNKVLQGHVTAIGLYGDSLSIGFSSKGGWDSFGLERRVTKSKGNILYELDGKPALDIYKSFLGEKAKDLPASGLLFPLSLRISSEQKPVVRTILNVNEAESSLTFAGNIPKGSYVRLMKANIDRLINGAEDSAIETKNSTEAQADFALLISCVGRRMVLKQLVEEEIEAVRDVLGDKPIISGFYSYGELAPFKKFTPCELHNQTMTITTFSEAV